MPTFQLVLMVIKLERQALKAALKRSAEYIFEVGGTLKKMENLGFQDVPYKITHRGIQQKGAYYFLMDFDIAHKKEHLLLDMFQRDQEVIRATSVPLFSSPENQIEKKENHECTVWKDFLPPPYREEVIKIQNAKTREETRLEKSKFKYFRDGKDYCPF